MKVCVTFVLTLNARYGIWLILFHMLESFNIHSYEFYTEIVEKLKTRQWMLFLISVETKNDVNLFLRPASQFRIYIFTCIMFYNNKMYPYMNTNHIVEAFCIAITSKNAIHKKILMIKSFGVEIEKMCTFERPSIQFK